MSVGQTKNVHFQEIKSLSSESSDIPSEANEKTAPGLALHQVFGIDIEEVFPIEILNQTVELEAKTASFWSKIFSWWYQPDVKAQTPSTYSEADLLEVSEVEPISAVPVLEELDFVPADLARIPDSKKTNQNGKLSQKQLAEALSLMSDRTLEEVMFIIIKAQLELEKESAHVAEGTFSNYQDFRKLQDKILQDVKDALVKDQQVMNVLKNIQNAAFAASFVCGLVAATVSFGFVAPVGIALTLTTVVAPTAAAGLTGLTTGSKAFYQRRLNEDKAKHAEINHQDEYYAGLINDTRERIVSIAESDNSFKERLIQLLKRLQRMCKLVSEK